MKDGTVLIHFSDNINSFVADSGRSSKLLLAGCKVFESVCSELVTSTSSSLPDFIIGGCSVGRKTGGRGNEASVVP